VVVLNGAVSAVNNVGSARINCAIQPDVETKLVDEIGSNILFENTSGLILPEQQGDPRNWGYLNTNLFTFLSGQKYPCGRPSQRLSTRVQLIP